MKPLFFGVAVVFVLLVGAGVGYYLSQESQPPVRLYAATQEIQSACTYLASNYSASLGLIAETPSHARYYLYSDNFLATLVLPNDCNNPSLAKNITSTLSRYDPSKIPNQYMALECQWNFNASNDYDLNGPIWTTVNNGNGFLSPNDYADVAFLQAYYDAECSHNSGGALTLFQTGNQTYNGIGFNDTAFQEDNSKGVYQTYKLALYIYTARLLSETVPLSALVNMARMQAPSGGFYTGYDASYSNNHTSTNTETTCLAIMALEVAFTTSLTQPPPPPWVYLIMALLFLVGLAVGFTIKRPSVSKPAKQGPLNTHPMGAGVLVHWPMGAGVLVCWQTNSFCRRTGFSCLLP